MSFSVVSAAFATRLDEARDILSTLRAEEASYGSATPKHSPQYKRLAGCCFVLIYGALEYGITQATHEALRSVASSNVELAHIASPLYAAALDSEFESAATVKRHKKWKSRLELLARQEAQSFVWVNDALFDVDLQTTTENIIQLILDIFGIAAPVSPTPLILGYLNEVKDKRNQVAHGRESAANVGSGLTSGDLQLRVDAINTIVLHFISSLETWFLAKDFIKASERHRYP